MNPVENGYWSSWNFPRSSSRQVDAPLVPPLPGGGLHFDESVHGKMLLMGVVENGQFLVGEILRTSGDAEVGNGFQCFVQEKANRSLFATDIDYSIRSI